LKPGWIGFKLYLNRLTSERPENGSTEFPVSEVLKADGDYSVLLSLEGSPTASTPSRLKPERFYTREINSRRRPLL
jgi:hypothetical protein